MIAVHVDLYEVSVTGHAGYREKGKDIICAAVSALAQELIRSLDGLTPDQIEYTLRDGYIQIRYENLSEAGRLLVDSFFLAISDLQVTYGEQCVRIL